MTNVYIICTNYKTLQQGLTTCTELMSALGAGEWSKSQAVLKSTDITFSLY